MSTNKTKTNKTNNQNVKVLPIGKTMTQSDIEALQARLAATEAALNEANEAKAALEAKVKTSKVRDVKAPTAYEVLQPVFVAIRGSVNQNIVDNDILINIFFDSINRLNITLDKAMALRIINKTVQHNSCSNIAKAETLASAEGRKAAYIAMIEQCKVLLCSVVDDTDYAPLIAEYNVAYNKVIATLK